MSSARFPFAPPDERTLSILSSTSLFLLVAHFLGGALMLFGGCLGTVSGLGTLGVSPAYGLATAAGAFFSFLLGLVLIVQGALLAQMRRHLESLRAAHQHDVETLAQLFSRLRWFFACEAGVAALWTLTSIASFAAQAAMPSVLGMGGAGWPAIGGMP